MLNLLQKFRDQMVKLGPHTELPYNKLAACNLSTFSKYVIDLLMVIFGNEVLTTHVIKGIGTSGKKPLNRNILADIISKTINQMRDVNPLLNN